MYENVYKMFTANIYLNVFICMLNYFFLILEEGSVKNYFEILLRIL